MPFYDCMLLLKPNVGKEAVMDLVARVGKHIYRRNGVVTDMKSFGNVQLGYGIKKLDGRYYQVVLHGVVNMQLPNKWLCDMVDESVYQFQSFCQYCAKMKSKTEQDIALLRQFDQVG